MFAKNKIKIGLVTEGKDILNWEYSVIKELIESTYSEISLIIYYPSPTYKKISFGLRIHELLDKLVFRKSNPYDSKIDSTELLSGISKLELSSLEEIHSHLAHINHLCLDLVICFNKEINEIGKLKLSKYGTLYYELGDTYHFGTISDCYWEIINKSPCFSVSLKLFPDNATPVIIFYSSLSLYPHSMFVNRNLGYHYAIDIIPRTIEKCFEHGDEFIVQKTLAYNSDINIFYNKKYDLPGSIKAFINLFNLVWRYLYHQIVFSGKSHWFLQYKIHDQAHLFPSVISSFRKLIPESDRFWADPFPICWDGRFYIFFEELIFKEDKGFISVLEVNDRGDILSLEKVIEKPYHMSYPFLLTYEQNLYMLPETCGNRTIEIYKCIEFPNKWELVMNLMENLSAKDSTLHFHDGLWWLFTSIKSKQDDISELYLFYATSVLTTEWKAHPQNPIVTDVKYERGAGNIFVHGDRLFRPSQDCSGIYGRAVNFNEILTLNTHEYREKVVSRMEPLWDSSIIGTHTFNFNINFVVVDTLQKRKRIKNPFRK